MSGKTWCGREEGELVPTLPGAENGEPKRVRLTHRSLKNVNAGVRAEELKTERRWCIRYGVAKAASNSRRGGEELVKLLYGVR